MTARLAGALYGVTAGRPAPPGRPQALTVLLEVCAPRAEDITTNLSRT